MVSKTFLHPGGSLRVNASLSEDTSGELVASFVDEQGEALEGFRSSRPLREGGLALAPEFEKDQETLAGQKVKVKLSLRKGKLYAYWLE